MIQYNKIEPLNKSLAPYIDSIVRVVGEGHVPSKKIMPKAGASMTFYFEGEFSVNGIHFKNALGGIRERAAQLDASGTSTDALMVIFTPFGLSRFTNIPMHELANVVVDPTDVFGVDADDLYERMGNFPLPYQRVALLEHFLAQRITPPSDRDIAIFRLTYLLRQSGSTGVLSLARNAIPLGTRQIERRFKSTIGVDIGTYIRICRFEKAHNLMSRFGRMRMTDIGYEAGYYDQSHFTNEFRRMVGVAPTKYSHCSIPGDFAGSQPAAD